MEEKVASASVIIPTKDSVRTIKMCLESIKNQTYPHVEIIVVDNYSNDGTGNIAGRYAEIYCKGPERSVQRNFGAEKAKGEYLLFIDSDMELTSQVVEECVREIQKREETKGIVIPEISVGEGFWARCKALERSCYIGDETIEAARFFDRKIFEDFGGYDKNLTAGEDWDLSQRIKTKYKTGRINSVIYHHEGKLSLLKTMRKKFYYAQKSSIYMKKHPKIFLKQANLIFRPAYFKNWRKLIKDPIHALGFTFMKFCESLAGGLGFLKGKSRVQSLKRVTK